VGDTAARNGAMRGTLAGAANGPVPLTARLGAGGASTALGDDHTEVGIGGCGNLSPQKDKSAEKTVVEDAESKYIEQLHREALGLTEDPSNSVEALIFLEAKGVLASLHADKYLRTWSVSQGDLITRIPMMVELYKRADPTASRDSDGPRDDGDVLSVDSDAHATGNAAAGSAGAGGAQGAPAAIEGGKEPDTPAAKPKPKNRRSVGRLTRIACASFKLSL
jgi:hypothetical protein